MISLSIITPIVLLIVVVFLMMKLSVQRRLLTQLEQEQQTLAAAWNTEKASLEQFVSSKRAPVITIEILNAVEVAANNSKFAGLIGKYLPDTIRNMVIKRTAETMREQMAANGVEVEVKVHDGH